MPALPCALTRTPPTPCRSKRRRPLGASWGRICEGLARAEIAELIGYVNAGLVHWQYVKYRRQAVFVQNSDDRKLKRASHL